MPFSIDITGEGEITGIKLDLTDLDASERNGSIYFTSTVKAVYKSFIVGFILSPLVPRLIRKLFFKSHKNGVVEAFFRPFEVPPVGLSFVETGKSLS